MDKKAKKVIALYQRAENHAAKSGLVKVNQTSIAKRAGVSESFVSKVLAEYRKMLRNRSAK